PETGYGYLEAGPAIEAAPLAFEVARFTEKPDLVTAEQMVATGRHYWNGGIFMFRAGDFLEETKRHAPEIHEASVSAVEHAELIAECILPSTSELEPCPNISVDYAVMERSDRVAMVPLDADWSDVGSWDALADVDARMSGLAQVTAINANNCYVRSDGIKVALLGVEDLIVVASRDQVLVMQKGHSQDIRQLAAQIAAEN
ncbi:MAG TPA: sugar phosphate nucleotidyltransferase, partial [Nitrospiraceae bacterium]|nr:sugar phosphate nucleotidyltransferase [Nitrospiraceae bacterium]